MSKRKVDDSLANVDASKPSPTKKKKKGTNSDFNGWWKLDLETSDTMEKYLGAMNLNEVAIQAALKGERDVETLHRFHLTSSSVTIERRSRMGNNTTKLVFGKPVLKNLLTGEKSMTASKQPGGKIEITIQMPLQTGLVFITDTRTINEEGNLLQVLSTDDSVNQSKTTRYYKRCPTPPPLPTPPESDAPTKAKKDKKK
jgi:hypothetical protein